MKRSLVLIQITLLAVVAWSWSRSPWPAPPFLATDELPEVGMAVQNLLPTPVFDYPVVEDAEISGYFDHDPEDRRIVFFDGRASQPEEGFAFSCPEVGGAWIGCEDSVTGEAACADERELWYDNHHGIDFEYLPNWHTGASCDRDRFAEINVMVTAPAPGIVDFVGEGDPYNGNYIRLYHDLDGDGNYYNDGLRSYYLHLADNGIVVDEGDILEAGDQLGYGGATGLSWTPHLHFEVQKRTDLGWVSVDPFGWQGPNPDPWYVPNHLLWQTNP